MLSLPGSYGFDPNGGLAAFARKAREFLARAFPWPQSAERPRVWPSFVALYATAGWVDRYNRRLRTSLGLIPPVEFDQAHYAALNTEPQPA